MNKGGKSGAGEKALEAQRTHKSIPAGELGSMEEVVFELDLESGVRISVCGGDKERGFGRRTSAGKGREVGVDHGVFGDN